MSFSPGYKYELMAASVGRTVRKITWNFDIDSLLKFDDHIRMMYNKTPPKFKFHVSIFRISV